MFLINNRNLQLFFQPHVAEKNKRQLQQKNGIAIDNKIIIANVIVEFY